MNGYVLIDKPEGWTSFDVVAKVRSLARQQTGNKKIKVGHAGTLDPMATGLLIVLIGAATKQQDSFMKKDKTYDAVITLGATSTTDDREGEIVRSSKTVDSRRESGGSSQSFDTVSIPPSEEAIIDAIQRFDGEQQQIPPQFSAIKVDGKRAYAQARKGQAVELKPRTITVHTIDNVQYAWPNVSCTLHVSSGTYIRSIARDVGAALECGAYLSDLRRTAIDTFSIQQAVSTDTLSNQPLQELILPLDK